MVTSSPSSSSSTSPSSPPLRLGQALTLSTPTALSLPIHTNHNRNRNLSGTTQSCSLLATSTASPSPLPKRSVGGVGRSEAKSYYPERSPTGRVWGSDRRRALDHFGTKSLVLSTTRVSLLQASSVLSGFITDQLEHELEREELLVQGKVTADELDRQNAEWEEHEWKSRWKSYPKRALTAILRFHAVTLLSRFYETIVFEYALQVTPPTLDRLTKDPFQSAIRKQERLARFERRGPSRFRLTGGSGEIPKNQHQQPHRNPQSDSKPLMGNASSTDVDDIRSKKELGIRMFHTCFYSSVVSFLADHTVQQCLLAYGYYIYYRQKKKASRFKRLKREEERLLKSLSSTDPSNTTNDDDTNNNNNNNGKTNDFIFVGTNDADSHDAVTMNSSSSTLTSDSSDFGEGEKGGIFVSFFHRSTRIAASRGLGLVAASAAGSLGSVIYPGWGTTVGIQLGDALVSNLLED